MQTLAEYLSGKDKAAFARQIGVSPAQLSQYISGYRRPGYDRMVEIESATDGAVPIGAWAAHTPSPVNDSAQDQAAPAKKSSAA